MSWDTCPCGMRRYNSMVHVPSSIRPRGESSICADCLFSWGVK